MSTLKQNDYVSSPAKRTEYDNTNYRTLSTNRFISGLRHLSQRPTINNNNLTPAEVSNMGLANVLKPRAPFLLSTNLMSESELTDHIITESTIGINPETLYIALEEGYLSDSEMLEDTENNYL